MTGGNVCGTTAAAAMAIPNDLLVSEVLSRLPVKSLLRFSSVCRSWCAAVADPAFARRHLTLSRRAAAATPPSVLAVVTCTDADPDNAAPPEDLISFHRIRPGRQPSSAAAAADVVVDVEQMQELALECSNPLLRSSHCDGLVAVAADVGRIFVCNPATREFVVLPPGSPGPYDYRREEAAVLSVDPRTGVHVVTRCLYQHYGCHTDEHTGEQSLEYDIVHEVFVHGPSGSGGWEATTAPPCPVELVVPPAHARGAFYWAANDQSDPAQREHPNALLRFAIHDGVFDVVPLPPGVAFMAPDDRDALTELGGEICYMRPTGATAFDFWMLPAAADAEHDEEEEGHGRWSLRWCVDFGGGDPIDDLTPLYMAPDGTLTVDMARMIYRLDKLNNFLEKVVDMAAVYWHLVEQLGLGNYYDYSEKDYRLEIQNGRWRRVQDGDGPALPSIQSLFTYVESLIQIN
uniref:F-box domain-containing protein n=1 Tax=Oryza meridionalis TaxID=40149 RepID=A0A0E0FC21_9ORYZ